MNRYLIVYRTKSRGVQQFETQYAYNSQRQAIEFTMSESDEILYTFKIKPK